MVSKDAGSNDVANLRAQNRRLAARVATLGREVTKLPRR